MSSESMIAFLLARITEDEDAVTPRTQHLNPGGHELLEQFGDFGDDERWMIEIPAARVLAECAAKRLVLTMHEDYMSSVRAYRSPRWQGVEDDANRTDRLKAEARGRVSSDYVQALAQPYADHPEFRDEWRWENR